MMLKTNERMIFLAFVRTGNLGQLTQDTFSRLYIALKIYLTEII